MTAYAMTAIRMMWYYFVDPLTAGSLWISVWRVRRTYNLPIIPRTYTRSLRRSVCAINYNSRRAFTTRDGRQVGRTHNTRTSAAAAAGIRPRLPCAFMTSQSSRRFFPLVLSFCHRSFFFFFFIFSSRLAYTAAFIWCNAFVCTCKSVQRRIIRDTIRIWYRSQFIVIPRVLRVHILWYYYGKVRHRWLRREKKKIVYWPVVTNPRDSDDDRVRYLNS